MRRYGSIGFGVQHFEFEFGFFRCIGFRKVQGVGFWAFGLGFVVLSWFTTAEWRKSLHTYILNLGRLNPHWHGLGEQIAMTLPPDPKFSHPQILAVPFEESL